MDAIESLKKELLDLAGADALGWAEPLAHELRAQGIPEASIWRTILKVAHKAKADVANTEAVIDGFTSVQPEVKARRMRSGQVVRLVDDATKKLVAKAPTVTAMARTSADPATALGRASGEFVGRIPPRIKRENLEPACRMEIRRLKKMGTTPSLSVLAAKLGCSESRVSSLSAYRKYLDEHPQAKQLRTMVLSEDQLAEMPTRSRQSFRYLIEEHENH